MIYGNQKLKRLNWRLPVIFVNVHVRDCLVRPPWLYRSRLQHDFWYAAGWKLKLGLFAIEFNWQHQPVDLGTCQNCPAIILFPCILLLTISAVLRAFVSSCRNFDYSWRTGTKLSQFSALMPGCLVALLSSMAWHVCISLSPRNISYVMRLWRVAREIKR